MDLPLEEFDGYLRLALRARGVEPESPTLVGSAPEDGWEPTPELEEWMQKQGIRR